MDRVGAAVGDSQPSGAEAGVSGAGEQRVREIARVPVSAGETLAWHPMTTAAAAVPNPSPEVEGRLRSALRGFESEWGEPAPGYTYSGSLTVPPTTLRIRRIVRWLLEMVVGSKNGGRWEKVSWCYWFRFTGHNFTMTFGKFGLSLSGSAATEAEFASLADEIVRRLDRASSIAEREVFQSVADVQMKQGSVTILNDYHRLRGMYDEFRSTVERGLSPGEVDSRSHIEPGFVRVFVEETHRFHFTIAMLTAYFSR